MGECNVSRSTVCTRYAVYNRADKESNPRNRPVPEPSGPDWQSHLTAEASGGVKGVLVGKRGVVLCANCASAGIPHHAQSHVTLPSLSSSDPFLFAHRPRRPRIVKSKEQASCRPGRDSAVKKPGFGSLSCASPTPSLSAR